MKRRAKQSKGVHLSALPPYDPQLIKTVMHMWSGGVAVVDISPVVRLSPEEVNDIIDKYSPAWGSNG